VSADRADRADLRTLVATAARVLALAGLFDMHGHISVRDGDTVYINDRGSSRISSRPDQVAAVRLTDGKPIGDREPPSETPLHLAIYRARRDAGSVAHFHPRAATAFAVAGRPLVVASNAGAWFGGTVPVYDDPELVRTDALGQAVARDLGAARALLLRGHGAVVLGEDIPDCVTAALFLEESAERLQVAASLGEPHEYSADELARVRAGLVQRAVTVKTWTDAVERARAAGRLDDLD
jgi:ribulose-5-phosphate 4-epimerase/fuculose-1-phosphate aldolase